MTTHRMLEDKTMTDYIMWRKVEGYDGFFIPDIISFVRNALPRYFPDQNQVHISETQLADDLISRFLPVGLLSETAE